MSYRILIILLAPLIELFLAGSSQASTLTSTFSIGYGLTANGWDTSETDSSNRQQDPGFKLNVSITGMPLSPTGPTFDKRTLGAISETGNSGLVSGFTVTLQGIYDGPPPPGAASEPHYKVQISITRISIWAAADAESQNPTLNFHETTPDNDQVQDALTLVTKPGGICTLANYAQLKWAPKDTASPTEGTSQTRSFELMESAKNAVGLDGFEVQGTVVVTYDGLN